VNARFPWLPSLINILRGLGGIVLLLGGLILVVGSIRWWSCGTTCVNELVLPALGLIVLAGGVVVVGTGEALNVFSSMEENTFQTYRILAKESQLAEYQSRLEQRRGQS
jgi:hypothetical protein